MALAIEHKTLGHIVILLLHQSHLDLVLNLLHRDTVVDVKVRQNFGERAEVDRLFHRIEGLDDGVHNLVEREAIGISVSLGDCQNIAIVHNVFLLTYFSLQNYNK